MTRTESPVWTVLKCRARALLLAAAVGLLLGITGLLNSCAGARVTLRGEVDYWPTDGWLTAEPESVGMDSGTLASMYEFLTRGGHRVDGIILIKEGRIVTEAYRQPYYSVDRLHNIFSCTKSVTSACVGIAIDQGLLPDVDTPVDDLFPDYQAGPGYHTGDGPVTLENLLTMTTGLDAQDSYLYNWTGLVELQASDDWIAHAFSLANAEPPGSWFDYSNTSSFLLSAAVGEASGMSQEEFAAENLFGPLGIDEWWWRSNPQGITIGWGDLLLRPRDMAKFGFLYLHGGEWEGQQIIPRRWIERSWTRIVAAGSGVLSGYGYQWWTDQDGTYAAVGYHGQYIFINPHLNLVMVVTSTLPEVLSYVPYSLYSRYALRAVTGTVGSTDPANSARLNDAVARFEAGERVSESTAVPNAAPPAARSGWAGIYDLDDRSGGLRSISFEFPPDSDADVVLGLAIDQDALLKLDGISFATTAGGPATIIDVDPYTVAAQTGWNDDGDLVVFVEMIGISAFSRLVVHFEDGAISVEQSNEDHVTFAYGGTRRSSQE